MKLISVEFILIGQETLGPSRPDWKPTSWLVAHFVPVNFDGLLFLPSSKLSLIGGVLRRVKSYLGWKY